MKKYLLLIPALLLTYSLNAQTGLIKKYPNVLNIKNIPKEKNNLEAFAFFDLGSWFGFGLPDEKQNEYKGSFSGPLVVSDTNWLGKSMVKFIPLDLSPNHKIDISKAKFIENSYYPGRLVQVLQIENLIIKLELIFLSDKTAVVKAEITNSSTEPYNLKFKWEGECFNGNAVLSLSGSEVIAKYKKEMNNLSFHFDNNTMESIKVTPNSYSAEYKNVFAIKKNKPASFYLFITQANDDDRETENHFKLNFLADPHTYYEKNDIRWNGYLNQIFNSKENWKNNETYKQGAVKCLMTLISNWKRPIGNLHHAGIVPAYSHDYFTGFWAWDSWKHAAILAKFEPELAKSQMRAMFDFQNNKGMIPDCVFTDSTANNWLDTKPPLASWAVWKIYEATKDKNFLAEFYPKLVKFHRWWYAERDHDKNGLCEYGSTENNRQAALWESGMDNAIRYDSVKMITNNDKAYSMNQESVDLNSYLYAEKIYLSKIADMLSMKSDAEMFIKEAAALKEKIKKLFFDKNAGYFFDINLDTKEVVKTYGPEGWLPLWANAADKEEAEAVCKVILNKNKFNTFIPFPTVAADEPKINLNGYWRGPVWLDQAYFGVVGLKNYGFANEARMLTEKIFNNLQGFLKSDKTIRENYNPLTGEGLNATNFSWSAAHLLLLWLGE